MVADSEFYQIASHMKEAGLPEGFISAAVKCALEFEGIADLLQLWDEESDKNERDEIVANIQDMIDACSQTGIREES